MGRTNPTRPPPCGQCGIVEPALVNKRHTCHPTHIVMHRCGAERAVLIGRSIVRFMRAGDMVTTLPVARVVRR
jgi:hypothetical protein